MGRLISINGLIVAVLLAMAWVGSVPSVHAAEYTVSYFWIVAPMNLTYKPTPLSDVEVVSLRALQAVSRIVVQAVNESGIADNQPTNEKGEPTNRIFTACVPVSNSRCLIFTNRTGGVVEPLRNVTDLLDTMLYLPPGADTLLGGGDASDNNGGLGEDNTTTTTASTPIPTTPEPSDRKRFHDQLQQGGYELIPCPSTNITGFNASWNGQLDVSTVYSQCISFYLVFVVADEKEVDLIGTPGGSGTNNDNDRNRDHSDPSNEFYPSIYPENPPNLTDLIGNKFTNKFVVPDERFYNMTTKERYEHILVIGHAFSAIVVFNGTTTLITNPGPATGIPYGTIFAICGGVAALGIMLLMYLCLRVRRRRIAEEEAQSADLLEDEEHNPHSRGMSKNGGKKKVKKSKKSASNVGSIYHPVANDSHSDTRWDLPRESGHRVRRDNDSICTMETRRTAVSHMGNTSARDLESPSDQAAQVVGAAVGVSPPTDPQQYGMLGSGRGSDLMSNNASFSQDDHQHLLPTTNSTHQFRGDECPPPTVVSTGGGLVRSASIKSADIADRNAIQ